MLGNNPQSGPKSGNNNQEQILKVSLSELNSLKPTRAVYQRVGTVWFKSSKGKAITDIKSKLENINK